MVFMFFDGRSTIILNLLKKNIKDKDIITKDNYKISKHFNKIYF